jgi:3-methylcrotonyl-CoA carboxylase alpha subunit
VIYTYQHGDRVYTVSVEPQADGTYLATIDDANYNVRASDGPNGALLLETDSRRMLVHAAANEDERYLHIDGRTYTVTVPETRTRRRSSAGSGDLNAQMPGQVIEVLVSEGDAVESGQALVVLEAMKMEIRVTAPADGVVKQLRVAVGDVVERGQILIELGVHAASM